MTATRWMTWAAGVGAVGALVQVMETGAPNGGSTAPRGLVLLSATAGLTLVTASVLCRRLKWPGLVWVLGATWVVPWLTGLWALPASAVTAAGAWSWVLAGLVVLIAASLRSPGRSAARPMLLAVAGSALGALSRVFLHDPLLDADCWLTCRHNPLAVDGAPPDAWAAGAGLVCLAVALLLAAVEAPPSRDRAALATLGTLTILGLAIGQWGDAGSSFALAVSATTQLAAVAAGVSLLAVEVDTWRVRRRLRHFAIGLTAASGAGGVPKALVSALGDTSVDIHYWSQAREGFVDAEGRSLSASVQSPLDVEVMRAGRPLALISTSRSIGAARLSSALGPALRLTLENEQLTASLRAELADLEESRSRLLERTREERRRLERNLHDGAQQRVVTVLLSLRVLARQARGAAVGDADAAAQAATRLLEELRHVARGIHPAVVADAGLLGALMDLAAGHPELDVRVEGGAWSSLSPSAQTTVYELAAEVLDQTDRSAPATVQISATSDEATTTVEIHQDADPLLGASALDSIAAQVDALNGRFLTTGGPGDWRLRMELPCES